MRRSKPLGLICLALMALASSAGAADIQASAPRTLSVTIYRNPYRGSGSIRLNQLGGFALVTETRTVHLPAGESRLRFEGVVDGIQPASAIVTGLPYGVIEKNRDAALLSPEALMRAAIDAEVTLVRTNRKTGKTTHVRATIRSASDEGVVFETAQGVEALRCSGLPETFRFERVPAGLTARPTLSVLTRAAQPITTTVTLSYLADGFDWAANYVAHINPDGKTLDLGAWITLANGNGASLPDAAVQIVAGRLHRVGAGDAASWDAPRVIAHCWPQGTTSDPVAENMQNGFAADTTVGEVILTARRVRGVLYPPPPMALPPAPPPPPPPPEDLGDLKLYRVPQATTVAARQSKQVRLLEQPGVDFVRLCTVDLPVGAALAFRPAGILLRTKNTLANHLGLPLPSGDVAVFDHAGGRELLVGQAGLHDTAVDEDVDLHMGVNPDVQVRQTPIRYVAGSPEILALTPQIALAALHGKEVVEVEITNARSESTAFELRLQTPRTLGVVSADQPMAMKDGRPIFRLTLPPNGSIKLHYAVTG